MWGAEKQLLQLIQYLQNSKHSFKVFSRSVDGLPNREIISKKGLIHRLPTTTVPGLSMLLFTLMLPFALLRSHFQKKFDLIHLPLPDLYLCTVAITRYLLDIPVIARIAADELDLSYSHGFWRLARFYIRSIILKMEAIQTLNPYAQKQAKNLGVPSDQIFLIPNGVRVPDRTKEYGDLTNQILYVGAMRHYPRKRRIEQKNLIYLIDAFGNSLDSVGKDKKLILVGDGNYRPVLEVYVSSKGLENNIEFVGYQTNVWKFLFNADIFVNPSHYEGMPNSVLEAMAAGLYVLCSDIPEHRYLIGDNEYGDLFEKSDKSAFVEALTRFYSNPDKCIQKAKRARELIQQSFSISICSMDTLTMFYRVVKMKDRS
jgi:glycosyltransferase involved in cell wall biosynthesis